MELLEEEELSENGREFLGKIRDQMEKTDFLMQSMVKMSRLEAGILQIRKENKKFYEQSGGSFPRLLLVVIIWILSKKLMTKKEQDAFIESMELGKQQTLFFYS